MSKKQQLGKDESAIGFLGLGKMGLNLIQRLRDGGIPVIAWNRGGEGREKARALGFDVADTPTELISRIPSPRVVWLMVPASAVDEVLSEVVPLLVAGDMVIDGGNCFFEDTIRRAKVIRKKGLHFVDAGVSGGPAGARNGACVMVGGEQSDVKRAEHLFKAAAAPGAYIHAGKVGAGHFVKMVHNGIEYGMMQALAEGFAVLRKSTYRLNLASVAGLYGNRSVIESRLVSWLEKAYLERGNDLIGSSGRVDHTGEGAWTIRTARKMKMPVPVISASLAYRIASARAPSYAGKVLTALRNQFGGHDIAGPKKHVVKKNVGAAK